MDGAGAKVAQIHQEIAFGTYKVDCRLRLLSSFAFPPKYSQFLRFLDPLLDNSQHLLQEIKQLRRLLRKYDCLLSCCILIFKLIRIGLRSYPCF